LLFAGLLPHGILTNVAVPAKQLPKACPLKRRPLIFRLTAVLLGLSIFPLFEATCRIAGWGAETTTVDAWQQFAGTRPLFQRTPDGSNYRIAANRREFFADDSFPVHKSADTRRIFVFGGSTVQGRPFSLSTSFTTFLQLGLTHAVPDTQWEVVNCGGISYASYRLLPIMQECLAYDPDLFVVCTGHNEYLECITYAKTVKTTSAVNHGRRWLESLHSFRLLRQTLHNDTERPEPQPATSPALLPEEVDAILDHQGGLDHFTRSTLHRSEIASEFGRNLQRMVELSKSASVPLIMMSPPVNLRDCPPFKSEFSDDTTLVHQKQVTADLKAASDQIATNVAQSIALLEHATTLDAQFAFSWYQLGQAYLQAKRFDRAKVAFQRAIDEDVCPLRMTSELQQAMQQVVQQNDVPFLNVQQLMEPDSRLGIVGEFVLADHIHPSFGSHQRIALELANHVGTILKLPATQGWQPFAQKTFDEHLQSLDDLYFLRGRRTLANLKAWTQGRADGPPLIEEK